MYGVSTPTKQQQCPLINLQGSQQVSAVAPTQHFRRNHAQRYTNFVYTYHNNFRFMYAKKRCEVYCGAGKTIFLNTIFLWDLFFRRYKYEKQF